MRLDIDNYIRNCQFCRQDTNLFSFVVEANLQHSSTYQINDLFDHLKSLLKSFIIWKDLSTHMRLESYMKVFHIAFYEFM